VFHQLHINNNNYILYLILNYNLINIRVQNYIMEIININKNKKTGTNIFILIYDELKLLLLFYQFNQSQKKDEN
jgi:hypothetical protein